MYSHVHTYACIRAKNCKLSLYDEVAKQERKTTNTTNRMDGKKVEENMNNAQIQTDKFKQIMKER